MRAGGEEVLAVVHRRGLLDDPRSVASSRRRPRLALEHERLHAARRARLEELRASRARIVAAADAERRALERDLHDGAQQRLVTLALAIRLARRQIAADDAALDAAPRPRPRTGCAPRWSSCATSPTACSRRCSPTRGSRAALEELAEHAPRLVPRALPAGRFPGAVESAAYFAALESLRLAEREVTVDAVAENGCLRLVIGAGAALDGAMTADRGPRRRRRRHGGGRGRPSCALEMPCES